jgi:hypothetical protein
MADSPDFPDQAAFPDQGCSCVRSVSPTEILCGRSSGQRERGTGRENEGNGAREEGRETAARGMVHGESACQTRAHHGGNADVSAEPHRLAPAGPERE